LLNDKIKDGAKYVISKLPLIKKHVFWRGYRQNNSIALTFDDGPNPEITPQILKILHDKNLKATFFLVGEKVEKYPEIVKKIVEEGHQIGNHTYSHKQFDELSNQQALREINRCAEKLKAFNKEVYCLRPPKGDIRWRLLPPLIKNKIRLIFWSKDAKDYLVKNSTELSKRLENISIESGDIILLHDWLKSTVEVLPDFIDNIKKQGFHLVTVAELLNLKNNRA
jgi:peptidoglycan/xylan/chitin deacetylase (PgdA/CDA1 family)